MQRMGRGLGGLIGGLMLLGAMAAGAFQPARPFDPRLLMPAVEARAREGHFRFVVFGDSKNNPPFTAVLARALAEKPDFALSTGDLVERGAGAAGAEQYDRLAEMAGSFMRRIPTWPVGGNHEISGGDVADARAKYAHFFGLSEDHYAFDVGPARFISLPWPEPDAAGRVWLERELKGARGRLIFVFQHNPYYTAGSKELVKNAPDEVTRLFTRYRVTAVFQGHDHGYYRTRRDGVWYITSAGAGAQIYRLNRFREARPEDVFYGQAPLEGSPVEPNLYWLHQPGTPDRTFHHPLYYVVVVDVDGRRVTARTITSSGTQMDAVSLSEPASSQAAARATASRLRMH